MVDSNWGNSHCNRENAARKGFVFANSPPPRLQTVLNVKNVLIRKLDPSPNFSQVFF